MTLSIFTAITHALLDGKGTLRSRTHVHDALTLCTASHPKSLTRGTNIGLGRVSGRGPERTLRSLLLREGLQTDTVAGRGAELGWELGVPMLCARGLEEAAGKLYGEAVWPGGLSETSMADLG